MRAARPAAVRASARSWKPCPPVSPASASLVQHGLGASKAAAFDLNAACSGFVYALATAYQFIKAGMETRPQIGLPMAQPAAAH